MEKETNVKLLRKKTGLTQQAFAKKYQIPVQTLKQWESSPGSTSHRLPPDYIIYMLDKLIEYEHAEAGRFIAGREEDILNAAEKSKGDAKLWLRYLRKEFVGDVTRISPQELAAVINSGKLTMYQKISLLRAIEPGTDTNRYVLSLNEPAATPMIEMIRRRNKDDQ